MEAGIVPDPLQPYVGRHLARIYGFCLSYTRVPETRMAQPAGPIDSMLQALPIRHGKVTC